MIKKLKHYTLYFLLVLFTILIAIDIKHLIQTPPISDHSYLHKVYPLLSQTTPAQQRAILARLHFFYTPTPASISPLRYFTMPIPRNLNIGAAYCLSWMPDCHKQADGSFFLNLYHTHHAQQVATFTGRAKQDYLEVMHYGWYQEPGIYFYVATGSGIFLKLGRSLIASNKIDAAKKLGISSEELLKIVTRYVAAYPQFKHINTYATVKNYAIQHHISVTQAWNNILKLSQVNRHYNRIADSRDYDLALYLACRKHHYSTLQLTTQPNDNGGWAYEIMDCRSSMNKPLLARWKTQQHYLSQRNPLRLSESKSCMLHLPIKYHMQCKT